MAEATKVSPVEEMDKPQSDGAPASPIEQFSSLDSQHKHISVNTTQPMEGITYASLSPTTTANSSPVSPQNNNSNTASDRRLSTDTSEKEAGMGNTDIIHQQDAPQTDLLVSQLQAQLHQQRHILNQLEVERSQYRHDTISLEDRIRQMNTTIQQRAASQQQLETNYRQHLESLRATPDDLTTISQKLKDLKKKIRDLADELIKQADPVVATHALRTFWLNLHDCINNMGDPLPLHRLRMLTEKFMMDVLVQNMNLNVFPGLTILDHYNDMAFWLERYDTYGFATRLRQEIALVMCKENNSLIQQKLQDASYSNWKFLYGGLVKAYPFIYQHDKQERVAQKQYAHKIQGLVELAMVLGFAMKGQEVDVAAAETRERVQAFDPDLMVDEDGQTSGIVDFCICPPFVVYGETIYTLEKGRVLCSTGHPGAHHADSSTITTSAPIST
ncbi:hypothetical protein BC941DRAFT_396486 [Chlamydoabsidia padenii]|nr:hypothetical protein BC941DRAFT_396486 [Chlamydoabsidia padenii]